MAISNLTDAQHFLSRGDAISECPWSADGSGRRKPEVGEFILDDSNAIEPFLHEFPSMNLHDDLLLVGREQTEDRSNAPPVEAVAVGDPPAPVKPTVSVGKVASAEPIICIASPSS